MRAGEREGDIFFCHYVMLLCGIAKHQNSGNSGQKENSKLNGSVKNTMTMKSLRVYTSERKKKMQRK